MTSFLVPMDGSDAAEAALEYAIELDATADITVLYVIDVTHVSTIGTSPIALDNEVQEAEEERVEAAFERARELAAAAGHTGELETVTGVGQPARSIVDHAEDVDAIVMGSHGRDGAARILLGSVAETVVRRAPVPVTVVR